MILQAKKDLNIDLEKSFMIWDNEKDIISWKKSWCKTILYNSNNFNIEKEFNEKSDFITKKWSEIEKFILK